MAITLAQATARLADWIAADEAVAKGQSYSIGDRSLSRVDAETIRDQIQYWSRVEAQLQRVAAGQGRVGISLAKFV